MRRDVSALVGGLIVAAGTLLVAEAKASGTTSTSAKPVAAVPVAGPIKIESLTPAQRMNAPDSTMVTFQGRTVSLGSLRAEQQHRMARLSSTPARAQFGSSGAVQSDRALTETSLTVNGTMVPMQAITFGAADYRSFCGAADASGCLYFPGLTKLKWIGWIGLPDSVWDEAPLMTDKAVCDSLGGYMGGPPGPGCAFPYPLKYKANFSPGLPPPGKKIGYGVSFTKSCTSPKFTVAVDPKGGMQMSHSDPAALTYSSGAATTCLVRVYVPK